MAMVRRVSGGSRVGKALEAVGGIAQNVAQWQLKLKELQQQKEDASAKRDYMMRLNQQMSEKGLWDMTAKALSLYGADRKAYWDANQDAVFTKAAEAGLPIDREKYSKWIMSSGEGYEEAMKGISDTNNIFLMMQLNPDQFTDDQVSAFGLQAVTNYDKAISIAPESIRQQLLKNKQMLTESFKKAKIDREKRQAAAAFGETPESFSMKKAGGYQLKETAEGQRMAPKPVKVGQRKEDLLNKELTGFIKNNKETVDKLSNLTFIADAISNKSVEQIPSAVKGIQTAIVRLFEKGVLTDQDIERHSPNPEIASVAQRLFKRHIEGLPLKADIEELKQYSQVLKQAVTYRANSLVSGTAKAKSDLIGVSEDEFTRRLFQMLGVQKTEPSTEQQLIKRVTKDGKTALFDATTKKFVRYE